ncbi:MAG: hypothetical protein IJ730_06965, partial [Alphaproteobacteria bacterium]|nr:hypothetical protein [Alphaproteobacteria bacterium]
MRRKGAKDSITRSAAYSIGLHLILLFFTISSVFIPRKENNLLMDIELIGEGEFRDDMAHAPAPVDNVSVKTDPIEKIEKEQLLIREPAPLESENNKIDANISEEKEIPETVNNEIPELEKEIPEEKIEEKTPEKIEKTEDPVPQKEIKKEKQKKSKKISPKKKKNRNKKALLDVINNAEKKQRRKNHRKMLQQLVNKEEKRKRDTEFNDILSDKGYGEGSGRGRKGKGLGALGKGTGITEGDYEMISSQI